MFIQKCFLPVFGKRNVQWFFEPLPDSEHPFDVMESSSWLGGYYMFGISQNGYPVSPEAGKANRHQEQPEWKEGPVTIIGKLTGKIPFPQGKEWEVYTTFSALNQYQAQAHHARIEPDGTFRLTYLADRPALSCLSVYYRKFAYYAQPGDTLYIEIADIDSPQQRFSIRSASGNDTHPSLLTAAHYILPDYEQLARQLYKQLSTDQFFMQLDTIQNTWSALDGYLACKYGLTAWESHVLSERTSLYFDYLRIRFVALQEGFLSSWIGPQVISKVMPSDEETSRFSFLRKINISDSIRYCLDTKNMNELLIPLDTYSSCFAFLYAQPESKQEELRKEIYKRLFGTEDTGLAYRTFHDTMAERAKQNNAQ